MQHANQTCTRPVRRLQAMRHAWRLLFCCCCCCSAAKHATFGALPPPGVPRSTACHAPHHSSHSLTRRHGNVSPAGKHVRRVYRIWGESGGHASVHVWWLHRSNALGSSPASGGLGQTTTTMAARKSQLSCMANVASLPPNLCTRRAKKPPFRPRASQQKGRPPHVIGATSMLCHMLHSCCHGATRCV
jgi:hypothetical protein